MPLMPTVLVCFWKERKIKTRERERGGEDEAREEVKERKEKQKGAGAGAGSAARKSGRGVRREGGGETVGAGREGCRREGEGEGCGWRPEHKGGTRAAPTEAGILLRICRVREPIPETECANEVLGDVSHEKTVFAAAGQNLAECEFDPRTFGL